MRHLISKTTTFIPSLLRKVQHAFISSVFILFASFASFSSAEPEDIVLTLETAGADVKLSGPWWAWATTGDIPAATDEDGDGVWELEITVEENFEYLWVVDGELEDLTGFADDEDDSCAPIQGSNEVNGEDVPFANRKWVVGAGNVDNVFESCAGFVPYTYEVTYSVDAPESAAYVRLTAAWWENWGNDQGPVAAYNASNGLWEVTMDSPAKSFDYLWVVGSEDTPEGLVKEDLWSENEAGNCGNANLNVGGSVEGGDNYANRQWIYGAGDVSDVYGECSGLITPPSSPDPLDSADSVLSIFGIAHGNLLNTDFNPSWNQETNALIDETSGLLIYYSLNYQGITLPSPQDVSGYEYLNLDIYTNNSTELEIFLINDGGVETSFDISSDITFGEWVNVQIPLMAYAGIVDLTAITQLKVDGDGDLAFDNIYFGGVYDPSADYDNDFVDNQDDPLPSDAGFFDMSKVAIADAFGGVTIGEGSVYAYPNTAESWAGFANKNKALYPIDVSSGGKITFTGSVPSGGDVDIKFDLQDQPSPATNADLTVESNVVTVSGATPAFYTATFEASSTAFNNLLMYIITREEGVVVTDVVLNSDTQVVSINDNADAKIGGSSAITFSYNTSNASMVTGLGLNIHYDSSVLTPTSITDLLATNLFISPDVNNAQPDSSNTDGISATDMYIGMSWASFTAASWPGALPADLLTINFDVADDVTGDSTVIGFSASSTAAGYALDASRALLEYSSGSWDFDGSGTADALTDGLLLLRYAFGLRGSMLTADATDPASTLTDSEIQGLIEAATAPGSFADIDDSGSVDALTDGLLLLRYLFGLRGGMLVADATDPSANRADGDAVSEYINSLMP